MGVQINGSEGNVIATKGTFSGDVGIGGTLTYEDVTNIDSVGLVTARSGIEIGARPGVAASISVDGNMIVSGISTFGGDVQISSGGKLGIGTVTPSGLLHTHAATGVNRNYIESSASNAFLRLKAGSTSNDSGVEFFSGSSNIANVSGLGAGGLKFEVGGSERSRIDSDGRLLVGATTNNSSSARAILRGFAGDGGTGQGILHLEVNRTTTNCGADEALGGVRFASNEGHIGAEFSASAESAWTGSGDLPTYFRFRSCADGSGSLTEKLRISSSGKVSIASGAYGGGGTTPELYVRGTSGRQMKIHNSNAGTSSLQITNGTTGEGEDAGTQLFTQGSTGDFHIFNTFATGDIAFATKPSGGSTTERFRIHSNGCVTKPTNAMFKAVRTSNQTVSSVGWHVVQYNSDSTTGCFDIGDNFDTSSHKFTAPITGYYQFGLNQRIDSGDGSGNYFRVAFTVDGGGLGGSYPYGHAIYRDDDGFSYYTFSITSLIYLTAGQYVRAEAYSDSDTSWVLQDESQFYGYLVG